MTSRTVSICKFVGTVSLGLLTGLSFSLATVTVPTLFTLPSAASASRAFASVVDSARPQLRLLASLSSSAFMVAFLLSPRPYRHPYLLYTSLLILASRVATSGPLAPYLFGVPPVKSQQQPSSTSAASEEARKNRRAAAAARARMESSYEVLGSGASDVAHSEEEEAGSSHGSEAVTAADEDINGEEVRGEVEAFLKKQIAQTVVAGLGFLMAVVGIWGDGAVTVFSRETLVIGV